MLDMGEHSSLLESFVASYEENKVLQIQHMVSTILHFLCELQMGTISQVKLGWKSLPGSKTLAYWENL
jgi:hypothetical protein